MATGIINNASYEECWSDYSEHTGRILEDVLFSFLNGNDDMAKSHDLLVMLG